MTTSNSKRALKLTAVEQQIISFIIKFLNERKMSPTVREIGQEFGYKSTNSTHQVLRQLVRKGVITKSPKKFRGISITDDYKSFQKPTVHQLTIVETKVEELKPDLTPLYPLREYRIYMKTGNIIKIIAGKVELYSKGERKIFLAFDAQNKQMKEIQISAENIDAVIPSNYIVLDKKDILAYQSTSAM